MADFAALAQQHVGNPAFTVDFFEHLQSVAVDSYIPDDLKPALRRVLDTPDFYRVEAAAAFKAQFRDECYFPSGTRVDPDTYANLEVFSKEIRISSFWSSGSEGHYLLSFCEPVRFGDDQFSAEFDKRDKLHEIDLLF